ncbi:MAG TPA: sensor histidine kinase [Methyloceanibacter sp.]|nr:sensor histidine kinase [Methyloceanibacter sp.]
MTAEADRSWQEAEATRFRERLRRGLKASYIRLRRGARWLWMRLPFRHGFSSLTRRIVILNLIGLAILVSGILYLNQFRAGLIDAKVQSLLTQGEIIAGALAASAGVDTDQIQLDPEKLLESEPGQATSSADDDSLGFTIDPERAAPILRRLVKPTGSRARIYGRDGALILDSDTFYSRGEVLRYDLPPPDAEKPDALTAFWQAVKTRMRQYDLPLYNEIGGDNGKAYPEVASALTGTSVPIVRVNDKGELVVSVAVPVQRLRAVLGVLLLSTRGGDIDNIVAAERWGIVRVSLFAAAVTVVLSMILANTIAGPVQRLASAAERVRHSVKARAEIPDFTDRTDEIGHLSGALRDMTQALYKRIDAIESFAADVAHELKNPLTSLRSATETLPLVKTPDAKERLMEIIQHDVKRLDRLISDISDASRLDAELAREDARPVDTAELLRTTVSLFNDIHRDDTPEVVLDIAYSSGARPYRCVGHDSRLSQVIVNLLDNAISFSPPGGRVAVKAKRVGGEIQIAVEDEGPGIPQENLERIFERFYTDRPQESFGQNSGLGLNISRQIVVAHGGRLWAENRVHEGDGARGKSVGAAERKTAGARFVIRLPAA